MVVRSDILNLYCGFVVNIKVLGVLCGSMGDNHQYGTEALVDIRRVAVEIVGAALLVHLVVESD